MKELAQQLKDEHSLMFFARGYNYATALEAALKVKVGGWTGGGGAGQTMGAYTDTHITHSKIKHSRTHTHAHTHAHTHTMHSHTGGVAHPQ